MINVELLQFLKDHKNVQFSLEAMQYVYTDPVFHIKLKSDIMTLDSKIIINPIGGSITLDYKIKELIEAWKINTQ